MPAPYNVLDVCRYIIKYSATKQEEISNLKLQKELYFVQAAFLVKKGICCFDERMEAWDFGPVVPVAYRYFRKYGGLNISSREGIYYYAEDDIWQNNKIYFNDNVFSSDDKEIIEEIVDKLSQYAASFLVQVTHKQDPWKYSYQRYANNQITPGAIKEFFK